MWKAFANKSEDIPELKALEGEQAQGEWTLQVVDLAGRDIGKLHKWSLELIYGG
jgi:subtilisin-like proprotein convertase family protein